MAILFLEDLAIQSALLMPAGCISARFSSASANATFIDIIGRMGVSSKPLARRTLRVRKGVAAIGQL